MRPNVLCLVKAASMKIPLNIPLSLEPPREQPSGLVRVESLLTQTPGLQTIAVPMTCLLRRKVRRRLQLPGGPEIGLALPTGSVLEIGAVLHQDHSRAWVVEAALERVAMVRVKSWQEVARVAHAVGNLHRDIDPQPDGLLILWDGVMEELLRRLEVDFEQLERPFLGKPSWEH
jgi:urease accessory protein